MVRYTIFCAFSDPDLESAFTPGRPFLCFKNGTWVFYDHYMGARMHIVTGLVMNKYILSHTPFSQKPKGWNPVFILIIPVHIRIFT